MKERPILFSGPMVRAILDGTKTQTRRVLKRQPWASCSIDEGFKGESPFVFSALGGHGPGYEVTETRTPCRCPFGEPGDRLWVRERFYEEFGVAPKDDEEREYWLENGFLAYRASDETPYGSGGYLPWKPSFLMPRWASRIDLLIKSVRVERLQDISEADAVAEGIERLEDFFGCPTWRVYGEPEGSDVVAPNDPIGSYRSLFESINGPGSWDANPWVWVIEFERIGK